MKTLEKDKNYKKGTQFFNKGEYSKAINEFNTSLNTYRDNPLIYANLGLSYANLEQYDKAIEFLDKALELDIKQAQVWDAKVNLLDKLGRTEELAQTMKKFDETVKKNPELLGILESIEKDKGIPARSSSLYVVRAAWIDCFRKLILPSRSVKGSSETCELNTIKKCL